ncbi:hypothetical protein ACTJKO_07645 [Curtobacterium sp. 22159]|uniref:hypothetical protein n=1 Tax=Curtobacterium sp. 22159 TaxID=3453882 RepID=UPI003F876403
MSDYYGDAVIPDMLATPEQFAAFCEKRKTVAPTDPDGYLIGATPLVLDATSGAYYDADPTTGLATDPVIATALADATCMQALAWVRLRIDPTTGGVVTSGVSTAKGIGSARVSYGDAAEAAAARAAATSGLVPAAVARLRSVNLINTEPWTYG